MGWSKTNGERGPVGPQGIQGPIGIKGVDGKTWYSGTVAPSTATGIVGDFHINTSTWDIREKTAASTWTLRGNIKGAQGIQGIPGPTGPAGTSAWTDITGKPTTFPPSTHSHVKSEVGLANVDNVKQMPIAGGTFTGITTGQANTSYTVPQLRNVILSTADPSGGNNGDIWIKYK